MARLAKLQPLDPRVAAGPSATFGEVAGAAFGREQSVGELSSRNTFQNDVYEPLIGFFNSTIKPMDPDFFAHGVEGGRGDTRSPISLETYQALQDQTFHPDGDTLSKMISELDAAGVEYPPEILPEAIDARRSDLSQKKLAEVGKFDEVLARGSGAAGIFGQLAGGFGAGFDNLESIATMPIGAASRTGILLTALVEGGVNAATEVASTPTRNAFLKELGLPEESILANAGMAFLVGGALGGSLRTITKGAEVMANRAARRELAKLAEGSRNPAIQAAAQAVTRDLEDEAAAVSVESPEALREHRERAQEAAVAATQGRAPNMPDRPAVAVPRADGDGSELVDPSTLLVQPDVFQFKSEIVAPGGVTPKLQGVTEWVPHRAGVAIVFEYADGSRAIADGHQRTALARRIMEQDPTQKIQMRAEVFKEADGYTVDDIRVLAALKNIAEAADGMTARMAGDAAKVLRLRPEALKDLPKGPGISRAQNLSKLSDDAFDLYINRVIDERFAEQIGRMVSDPAMHLPIARLIERVKPETTEQAANVIQQALEAPTSRETTTDLFGESEVVQSLYLEQAKVLERAMSIMREDRSIFKTLTDEAGRIEGAGNQLNKATNAEARKQVETALVAIKAQAHRAGPISEALRDGAKSYKENGRLKDAAERVAEAVRGEVQRNGIAGGGSGGGQRAAQSTGTRTEAPDPNIGFDDPVGPAAQDQVKQTALAPNVAPVPAQVTRLREIDAGQAAVLEAEVKAAQAIKDLDDLMARAAVNHDDLTAQIAATAAKAGVTPRAAPLKGRARIEQKIRDKYAGDLNRITDVARGGVDAPTPEAAEAFIAGLSERYRILDEGWNVVDGGYFDRKLTVIFDDGQLGEVQLWVPGMFEVKEAKGHKLYEVYRDLSKPEAERAQALADMEELYAGVMNKLPDEWRPIMGQAGSDAPKASRTDAKASGETSGDPSSPSTSAGAMGDQARSAPSNNMDPGSGSTAGTERSTRNNLMGDTSNPDVNTPRPGVNTERTAAGDQVLIDGVAPVTVRDRLQALMSKKKAGGSAGNDTQIGGLFDPNDPARSMEDMFSQVPVGRGFDAEGNEISLTMSREELAADLDADDNFNEMLGLCLK